MNAKQDKAVCQDKTVCDYNEFRRTRYFHGMLLDDKDFRAEQNYHAGKRRLLNRLLHGSGIVCGLTACWNKKTEKIDVSSGLALDCCGNEIWVNHKLEISLSQLKQMATTASGKDPCNQAGQQEEKGYHLVICYKEADTDPVAVYLPGAGCDDRACEHSRTKEGYCFKLVEGVDCLPYKPLLDPCWQPKEGQSPSERPPAKCGQPGECPECGSCETSCCVTLGSLKVFWDAQGIPRIVGGMISDDCRKYVLTGQLLWQMIGSTFANPKGNGILVPGMETPTNDPVRALCSLLNNLKTVQRDIVELKQKISPVQADIAAEAATAKAAAEEASKVSAAKVEKPGKKQ